MEFEWDDNKNEANIKKHGISFETASFVFKDENRIEMYDHLHSTENEDRYITIGKSGKILYVIYTERKEKTRIISARLAEKSEKEAYYGNR